MAVVLLSGGIDSSTALATQVSRGDRGITICLAINYGQRHFKEIESARKIAEYYSVPIDIVAIPPLSGSSITGRSTGVLSGSHTVVPCRNAIMISFAVHHAIRRAQSRVVIGATATDAEIYPDCRESFVSKISDAMETAYGVSVDAPFVKLPKCDVVKIAKDIGVPLELTWSCYDGGATPCRVCGACVEREKAME